VGGIVRVTRYMLGMQLKAPLIVVLRKTVRVKVRVRVTVAT
jgi:hypothetical protein